MYSQIAEHEWYLRYIKRGGTILEIILVFVSNNKTDLALYLDLCIVTDTISSTRPVPDNTATLHFIRDVVSTAKIFILNDWID